MFARAKWIAVALTVLLLGALWAREHFLRKAEEASKLKVLEDLKALQAAGFQPAEIKEPERPVGAPSSARPVVSARGLVDFGPRSQIVVTVPQGLGETPAPPPSPCIIGSEDIRGGCAFDLVEIEGTFWAKQHWQAEVRLPDDTIVSREADLESQRLQVSPRIVEASRRGRFDLFLGAAVGLEGEPGLEFGASWASARGTGGYTLVERNTEDWRVHGGYRKVWR